MNQISSTPKWSLLEKIAFRLSFIYFSLFIIIENNSVFPFWGMLMQKPNELLHQFIPWFSKHILHLSYDVTVFVSGSSDTTYNYVIIFLIFISTVFGTAIWSVFDRKRQDYKKLYYWLSVAIRFYIALMLINYGLVKIIKIQFPSPNFYRLIEAYGDSSPMGLAWTFLGFSKGYNIFMGIAEISAVLLLFRRTLTIGAIITLSAVVNVMAVNYFFDIPVKILSTHLVLMTLFLLQRDFKKLIGFFFTGKSITLSVLEQPIYKKNWLKPTSRILKGLILVYVLVYGFTKVLDSQKIYGEKAPKSALYGLYEIVHFEKNGDTIPANIYDTERWRYLILDRAGSAQIHKMDKTGLYFKSEIDTLKNQLRLTSHRDSRDTFILNYKKTEHIFSFETIIKSDTIKARCKIFKKEDFLLMKRGFNWVNEHPFNR